MMMIILNSLHVGKAQNCFAASKLAAACRTSCCRRENHPLSRLIVRFIGRHFHKFLADINYRKNIPGLVLMCGCFPTAPCISYLPNSYEVTAVGLYGTVKIAEMRISRTHQERIAVGSSNCVEGLTTWPAMYDHWPKWFSLSNATINRKRPRIAEIVCPIKKSGSRNRMMMSEL